LHVTLIFKHLVLGEYYGCILGELGTLFTIVQERSTAAIKAIYGMKNLRQLSTTTAMALFQNAITPIVAYGVEIVWEKLMVKDIERIEKVKASFMKREMGLGMNAPSRMAYVLMGELFFIGPIYTRRANAHSTPTLLNSSGINRSRAFFRCSMEYSKNARSLDINGTRAFDQLLRAFLCVLTRSLPGAVSSKRSCVLVI
jgi:hypothetical protein